MIKKNMLRLDKSILANMLMNNANTIPIDLNAKYNDVYYAMKKSIEKKAMFNKNFAKSLRIWESKTIEDEEFRGYFHHHNLDSFEEGMFFVSFMSQWQLQLKNVHGYRPSAIMVDNSDTEIAAINKTYNVEGYAGDDQTTPVFNSNFDILICHWHILKAWKEAILKHVMPEQRRSRSMEEKKKMRDEALDLLVKIMSATSESVFQDRWEDFEEWRQENDAEWGTVGLLEYMTRNYIIVYRILGIGLLEKNEAVVTNNDQLYTTASRLQNNSMELLNFTLNITKTAFSSGNTPQINRVATDIKSLLDELRNFTLDSQRRNSHQLRF
ncbi:uncharacterized protein B0P05DRAFT_636093 [Gilbertella persicaria]|uniref:uncharacterized protein n=1 Tax=Gilbertella persicaria TaxID=101096 RepID=UPI002221043F|nr:uncharacterized protein B0P05DRAFT_636093 [Gilbertella persicaria]KAI8084383.1 hypothetical protein B0P05DRAFT_636093 [Gilbertella persicaria]